MRRNNLLPNEAGEGSDGDREADPGKIASLFWNVRQMPARIHFKWLDAQILDASAHQELDESHFTKYQHAFQKKNFDNAEYFEDVRKTQTRDSFQEAGFNHPRDIDNTYDILVEDVDDLMNEIDLEKEK